MWRRSAGQLAGGRGAGRIGFGKRNRLRGDLAHMLAWTAVGVGRGRELVDAIPDARGPWGDAAAAFAAGDLRGAADITGRIGARTDEAYDRLRLAQELVACGRPTEAAVEVQRALAF